jgi:hypothetical protein
MKLPSFRAEATMKPPFVLLVMIAISMIWASDVLAYEQYSQGNDSGNCADCHGDFRAPSYTSPSGDPWGVNLHDVHRTTMLNRDCNTCHTSGPFFPVIMDSSTGGNGLDPISCVGCHGRDGDTNRGAGLRQHHWTAGETGCVNCHSDSNPANYTPVGENVLPNYYASPGTGHPAMPTNSCNPSGGENFGGTTVGLDNDGNGIYDVADPTCPIPVELMIFEIE